MLLMCHAAPLCCTSVCYSALSATARGILFARHKNFVFSMLCRGSCSVHVVHFTSFSVLQNLVNGLLAGSESSLIVVKLHTCRNRSQKTTNVSHLWILSA